MKITWLGQAGLLFETDGKVILLDPYLSDSVERIEPHNRRRVPVDPRFLSLKPDLILLTHNHLDHTDPETLCHYLGEDSAVTVLIGPEGDFSPEEARLAVGHGFVPVHLGPSRLRTETAAVTAVTACYLHFME